MSRPVGFCFYTAASYRDFKEDSEDPEFWKESFESWFIHAEESISEYISQGFNVIRVPMDLAQFKLWSAVTGNKNDGEGRSLYAADQAQNHFS